MGRKMLNFLLKFFAFCWGRPRFEKSQHVPLDLEVVYISNVSLV